MGGWYPSYEEKHQFMGIYLVQKSSTVHKEGPSSKVMMEQRVARGSNITDRWREKEGMNQ